MAEVDYLGSAARRALHRIPEGATLSAHWILLPWRGGGAGLGVSCQRYPLDRIMSGIKEREFGLCRQWRAYRVLGPQDESCVGSLAASSKIEEPDRLGSQYRRSLKPSRAQHARE